MRPEPELEEALVLSSALPYRLMLGAVAVLITLSDCATAPAPANRAVEGSYQAVLILPKAKPTAILTFCPSAASFTGAWLEDGGRKFMAEMTDRTVAGNRVRFTVTIGPGKWNFDAILDGDSLKGTVSGDGATSAFVADRTVLEKPYCR